MKLFFYYATRTVKNQIKKLCKTWVAILLLVCVVFGMMIGLGAAFLSDLAGDDVPEEEFEETLPEDETLMEEEILMDPALVPQIAVALCNGVFLIVIAYHVLSADKSGSKIFSMADVNLLFASPMKPQSVMLFRISAQLGAILAATLYLIFQLPNLVGNMGIPLRYALLIFPVFFFLLAYAKLIHILFYTLASTHATVRRIIRPLGYGILLLSAGGFALYYKLSAQDPLTAAIRFFAAPVCDYIPVLGWLGGLLRAVIEGRYLWSAVYALSMILGIIVLANIIWRLRADFYEDALKNSSEMAEIAQAAQTEGAMVQRSKKDRSDKLRRDGLRHGAGASVLLAKSLYNRFRFAFLGVFTKTATTYLVISVGVCILLRTVFESRSLLPVVLTLGGMVFFRSLGNPIANDLSKVSFQMMPESPFKKIGFSLLAGTVDCFLDLLPALALTCVILGANPLIALCYVFLILSIDLYSSAVGAFIDLSLPVSLAKNIRSVVQILFIYFGLLPDAVLLIVGGIFGMLPLFCVIAALLNLVIGVGVGALCPLFLSHGRR